MNLSRHEVTPEQLHQLSMLVGLSNPHDFVLDQLVESAPALLHLDLSEPIDTQVRAMIDAFGLLRTDWDSDAIYLVPPDHSTVAATAIACIHGQTRFPILVIRRPKPDAEGFAVTGIVDLAQLRDAVRQDSLR